MTENPNPAQVVAAMLTAAREAESVRDMSPVGTYASVYAESVAQQVTTENVEAFLLGAAVVNVLIQEAVLRTVMGAREASKQGDTDEEKSYALGVADGGFATSRLIGTNIEEVMGRAAEQPVVDRTFSDIVAGMF